MISLSTIEKVRELSIVDVVRQFVDLKKSGSSYRAPSPFTNEKTSSFFVVPSKQIFKCFSSGKGGDGIRFVMEKEGVPYVDAVKILCNLFSIDVQYESNGQYTPEQHDEIEDLYRINQAAAARYAKALLEISGDHPAFKELIDRRRFTADTILQWQIGFAPGETSGGYAPARWNFLASTMVERGYYKQGIELGLIKTKDEVNYDTFRNRIIFPVCDSSGRCVAFGARALEADSYNAKYLNSAESRIYQKSKILYGLNYAAHAIREKGFALVMEGFTDVISFHQAGETNAVGTCGTALTEDQVKLLSRYTSNVLIVFDPDEAGGRASARSVNLFLRHGFQCSRLPLYSIVDVGKELTRKVGIIRRRPAERIIFTNDDGSEEVIEAANLRHISNVDPDDLVRMF